MVNIHLNSNRRGSLDFATFTSEQMQQFINELDAAYRSHRYVERNTILNLTAQAARDMIIINMLAEKFARPNERVHDTTAGSYATQAVPDEHQHCGPAKVERINST